MGWELVLIVVLSIVLMRATDVVVMALHGLTKQIGASAFGLAAVVAALSTSLPELLVGVTAAVKGNPGLSLGNVLGSNIADVSLIMGLAAVVGGSVGVVGEFLRRDFFTAFLGGALPLVLLVDGRLSRGEGLVLVGTYVIYSWGVLRQKRGGRQSKENWRWRKIWRRLGEVQTERSLKELGVGIVVMLLAANWLVKLAEKLAVAWGMPMFLMGLFLVAVGTSLPELVFEIEAIRKREIGMVYGNLLGSVVTNAALVLGVTAVIAPIQVGGEMRSYLWSTIAFVVAFGVFWLLVRTKRRLDRWEGVVLILAYAVFVYWEFFRAGGK